MPARCSASRLQAQRTMAAAALRAAFALAPCARVLRRAPARTCARFSASARAPPRANVVDVLRERGLYDNATGDLDALRRACEGQITVYSGFDPTAHSLHLGNLLAILALAWFQRCGHRTVALVGGATGRVGDPSGKSSERPVMDDDALARNSIGIERNIRQVLERSAQSLAAAGDVVPETVVLNNHDWVGKLSFLDFLRDVGKHARVGTMIGKESVRARLESEEGMSFTEFTYQLIQAYDFMHLSDTENVTVQLGGSDQWGNITAGIELARKIRSRTLYGITFPLLTTADGKKFGKSESGALWLTPSELSPYEFYQFLFRTPDEDVVKFLKRLTFLPIPDVDAIAASMRTTDYVANSAQRLLAEEVTRIVHGDEGVRSALAATAAAAPGSNAVLSVDALEAISADMPSVTLTKDCVIGQGVIQVMVTSGLQKSKGEARRLVKNGGAYINNVKVQNEQAVLGEEHLVGSKLVLLAAGKKNKMLVRIE